jgi:lysophospholipase L1-like esterase
MQIDSGQKILFIGDSITDCERRGAHAPLGWGYVRLFADMLTIRHPERAITVINKGIGGDVVTGLRDRWSDDVIRNRPDWLSIKIGINDLNRTLHHSPDPVPPQRYREAYEDIITRTRETLPDCKLLLIDPFYISRDSAPTSYRAAVLKLLPEYLRVVEDLGREHGTLRVNTHTLFQRLLETHEPDTFCPEPVHPNPTGHMVIADAVYAALSAS